MNLTRIKDEVSSALMAIVLIYVFINIAVLIWYLIQPTFFFEYIWFVVIFILFGVFVIEMWNELSELKNNVKIHGFRLRNTLATLIYLFLNIAIIYGSIMLVPYYLYDRYNYIDRSDTLFAEGKFSRALQISETAFTNYGSESLDTPPILFIKYLYERSSIGILNYQKKRYQLLINYAYCLKTSGVDINKSESLFKECSEYAKQSFPKQTEYLIFPSLNLTEIYIGRGDVVSVEKQYFEIFKLMKEISNKDVKSAVNTLQLLAYFSDYNSDFEKSFALRKKALDIYDNSSLSKESSSYLVVSLDVIMGYLNNGDVASAEFYLKKIKKGIENKNDEYIYLNYLGANGWLYTQKQDFLKSDECIGAMLKIIKENQGVNSLDYAMTLASQASNNFKNHNFSKSVTIFDQSLDIFNSFRKSNQYDYYNTLFFSAIANYYNNQINSAFKKLSQVKSYLISSTNNKFVFSTAEEKESLVSFLGKRLNYINSVYYCTKPKGFTKELYNNILFTKGIALQSTQFLKKQLTDYNNTFLSQEYDSIQKLKEEYRLQSFSGKISDSSYLFLQEEIRNEEKQLLNKLYQVPGYERFSIDAIQWNDVKESLKKGEIAIEIMNIPTNLNEDSEAMYFALILKPDLISPRLIPLFKESEINQLLNIKGTTIEKINTIYSGESLKKLDSLIWKPLESEMSQSQKIYLSVSGVLHQVSFAALTIDKNIDLQLVSSTRILAENPGTNTTLQNRESILYGNINYDFSSESGPVSNDEQQFETYQIHEAIQRSGFSSLPETAIEIDNISIILSKHGYTAKTFLEENATETSLRKISSNQPEILHIATHGFYYSADQSYRIDELMPLRSTMSLSNSPLFRSGLLFAGANKHNFGNLQTDGILTAFEISKINLSSTDLVVLSACETGLGDVHGYEGVFGLQRAFKMAGAKSLIVSLWKVPDTQTSELMQKFYFYYLEEKYSKHEALKKAQIYVRDKYHECLDCPFYWAAFKVVE